LARKRLQDYQGLKKAIPLIAVGLIGLEIVLGALVVLLGLPVQLTTVHFMVALAIFLLVLYMTACDGELVPGSFSFTGYAFPLFYLLLLIFSQASLGAYLRHSAAALACPDFPVCRGELFPDLMDLATTINISHRLLGLGIFGTAILLYLASLLDGRLKGRHRELLALSLLVVLQIAVGAAVVKSRLSYPITSVHLALTLAIIGLSLRVWLLQTGQLGVRNDAQPR
jgi:heme A synthase